MARWHDVETEAPHLATAARELLDAHVHKTLATLRRSGAPRISGSEMYIVEGDAWFGSMWESRKALDLRRDSRFALHSGSEDPPGWTGDARLGGRAVEEEDPARKAEVLRLAGAQAQTGPFHLFRAELDEVVVVRIGDPADHLVIESWTPERGVKRIERR
jgi:hypothetical protein